jgi:hypothetical protein
MRQWRSTLSGSIAAEDACMGTCGRKTSSELIECESDLARSSNSDQVVYSTCLVS